MNGTTTGDIEMCYEHEQNSNFRWRKVDEELPMWDHTVLVSDGKVIGLAGYTMEIYEVETAYFYPLWGDDDEIDTVTYYGSHNLDSKQKIKVKEIKYWAPIPSIELMNGTTTEGVKCQRQ